MNVTGLSLDEVTRLLRLAKRDVETLQAAVRKANAYAKRLEVELEGVSPECPSCLQLRRDRGGDHRAPVALQDGASRICAATDRPSRRRGLLSSSRRPSQRRLRASPASP